MESHVPGFSPQYCKAARINAWAACLKFVFLPERSAAFRCFLLTLLSVPAPEAERL